MGRSSMLFSINAALAHLWKVINQLRVNLQAADILLVQVAHASMPKGKRVRRLSGGHSGKRVRCLSGGHSGKRVRCLSGGHSGKDTGGLRLFQEQEAILAHCQEYNSPLISNNGASVISDKGELLHNAVIGYKVIGACGGV